MAGYSAGIILIISLKTFFDLFTLVSLTSILAAFSTIMIVALVGIFDDLISIKQGVKAFMPVFAALPLVALKEGFAIWGKLIMKICGGISERNLVLVLMGIEAMCGVVAILLYV